MSQCWLGMQPALSRGQRCPGVISVSLSSVLLEEIVHCSLLLSLCRGEVASSDAPVCWLPEHCSDTCAPQFLFLGSCSCPCWLRLVLLIQGLGFSAYPTELYGLISILFAFLFPFCIYFFSSLSVGVSLLA